MKPATNLVAAAVFAACGVWPLTALSQAGGSGGASGAGATDGGRTPYDTSPASPSRPGDATTSRPAATGSSNNTLGLGSASMSDADWERGRTSSYSVLPFTSYGYVGLNLGTSRWDGPCAAGFECDDSKFAGKIYTGGLISRMVGLELGYINFGSPNRSGGEYRAQGVNLSVVANLPVDPVNLFARFGTTYGWTKANAAPGSGVASGDENGFGLAYGAGIGFDISPQLQVTAEWDRNNFRFAHDREDLDLYSVGLRYKF